MRGAAGKRRIPSRATDAGLSASVRVTRGSFTLASELSADRGDVIGVVGANGAGKSTLLGALAGTVALDEGEIRLGTRLLSRAGGGQRPVSVPRSSRRVGMLDQRARLFPHLSARENIAFGPRAQGWPRAHALHLAEEWLERIRLPGRGSARAAELSGGQQQRVAIARTLAADPELLLLDEPFAALDVSSSAELRAILSAEVQRLGIPAILVTHDPIDLIALADGVVVLEEGRVSQRGAVADVLSAPAVPFAADLAGRSLVRGIASVRGTLALERAPVPELNATGTPPEPGRSAVVSYDPGRVAIRRLDSEDAVPSAARGPRWAGTVAALSASKTGVRVTCSEWPECVAEISAARALALRLEVGDRLEVSLEDTEFTFGSSSPEPAPTASSQEPPVLR